MSLAKEEYSSVDWSMDWSRERVQFVQLMEELAALSQGNPRMTLSCLQAMM